MKILIADDDATSRLLMEKMLRTCGYDVVVAADGSEAVSILSAEDGPKLALIDWMMPKMDGPEVCRRLRFQHDRAYVYIILLTSRQSKQDIIAGLESGADDYLTKPCHVEELKARLHVGERILDLEERLVEAREEMQFKATHDALTTLWNQGAILSLLNREMCRAMRERQILSLMLCDVDYFKQINDAHGHLVGDKVLIEVARRLQSAVRPYDSVGRYGGEEFLIVLTGCDEVDTKVRAEQIRNAICSEPFICDTKVINLTISVGVLFHRVKKGNTNVEDVLGSVDAALYKAKAAGRNCVAYANPTDTMME